jgi:hypothetical protein
LKYPKGFLNCSVNEKPLFFSENMSALNKKYPEISSIAFYGKTLLSECG